MKLMLAVLTISGLTFTGSDALSCLQCVETRTEYYVWYGRDRQVTEDYTPCYDYTGTKCSPGQDICTTTVIHVNSSLSYHSVIRGCGSLSTFRADNNAICKTMDPEIMLFNRRMELDEAYNFECQTEVCRTEMCNNGAKEAFRGSGRRTNTGNPNWYYTTDPYKFYFKDPLKARTLKPNETHIDDESWQVYDGSNIFEMQPRMEWRGRSSDWNYNEDYNWRQRSNDGPYWNGWKESGGQHWNGWKESGGQHWNGWKESGGQHWNGWKESGGQHWNGWKESGGQHWNGWKESGGQHWNGWKESGGQHWNEWKESGGQHWNGWKESGGQHWNGWKESGGQHWNGWNEHELDDRRHKDVQNEKPIKTYHIGDGIWEVDDGNTLRKFEMQPREVKRIDESSDWDGKTDHVSNWNDWEDSYDLDSVLRKFSSAGTRLVDSMTLAPLSLTLFLMNIY